MILYIFIFIRIMSTQAIKNGQKWLFYCSPTQKIDFFLNFLNKDGNKRNIIIQENLE